MLAKIAVRCGGFHGGVIVIVSGDVKAIRKPAEEVQSNASCTFIRKGFVEMTREILSH